MFEKEASEYHKKTATRFTNWTELIAWEFRESFIITFHDHENFNDHQKEFYDYVVTIKNAREKFVESSSVCWKI